MHPRLTLLGALMLFGWLFLATAVRAEDADGLATLTAKESSLKQNEVIAFLGDSITERGARPDGYVWLIEQALATRRSEANPRVIKAGVGGDKVSDLEQRLDRDVISKKPTVVFIYVGINDIWNKHVTSPRRFKQGLENLVRRTKKAGAIVVLATPGIFGERPNGRNPYDKQLDQYSAIGRRVAAEAGVTLCDLRKACQAYLKDHNPQNRDRGILTTDMVHLSTEGNRLVAGEAARAIAEALRKRRK